MSTQDLYKKGGLFSITSQNFNVKMLTSDIPTHVIASILVFHAERYAHHQIIQYTQCTE